MGKKQSTITSASEKETRRDTWKDTVTSFGVSTTSRRGVPPDNIFTPIQADNILPQFPIGKHHPVERKGIEDDEDHMTHTNKFYANIFLGNQGHPIWTHPYSIWWGRGDDSRGQFKTYGLNIAHAEKSDVEFGAGHPVKSYSNPLRKPSLILSAQELDEMSTLTTDTHLPFSVNINLNHVDASYEPKITFPIVQGMSFVTGGYRNATPIVQCPGDGFTSITGPFAVSKSTKYKIVDNDKRNWLLYINPVPRLPFDPKAFAAWDQWNFVGPSFFKGTLQIAKNPLGDQGEALYDKAASTFVTEAKITGTVNEARGQYAFDYTKVGGSPLLVFILPHHLQSLEPNLRPLVTKLQLRTTTKGMATAIWAERLSFIEPNLPLSMGFAPWHPSTGTTRQRYSSPVLRAMLQAAEHDLQIALTERTSPDSMYYAGKTLARLATIVWCMKEVLNYVNPPGLDKLKKEMSRYVANQQRYPLFYDDTWKGLVSNAGFPNDPTADFGNTYYNDHHFHYSYFVYTAAVLGSLDPEWLTEGDNKAWTQSLVKDYAESDTESAKGGGGSRDFPFFCHFDWWMGHSWARGLFECPDGKDEESSGEDGFASFAIKMWGKVIGDVDMEKRGNLMLALQARSFNNYFYLTSTNTNHPQRFIDNKVIGILFENKVEYTTYFGTDPYLIHGLHMLPLCPASTLLRPKGFVKEEWDRLFSDNRALVPGGWRGILYANLAIIDPKASWEFFKNGVNGTFEDSWMDGGASRIWYMVWAAGLGGVR